MRDEILDFAEEVVQEQGLEALSFQQIADAVGLSKASVFHHFRNRDALAMSLIERCRTKYGAEYSAVTDRNIAAPTKLRKIASSFEKGLKNNRLCLLASLGSSQASLPEPLQIELKETADSSVRVFSRVFQQGLDEGTLHFTGSAVDAARSFLALLQGLQQLARFSQDLEIFDSTVGSYLSNMEA